MNFEFIFKMQTAALFDLDGVLIDTETQYTRFWGSIGKRDFPDMPDFAIRIKGKTLAQIYDQYFHGKPELQRQVTAELNHFEQHMDFPWIAGVTDFVKELRAAGFKTGVVTSSNRPKMECLLQAHPDFTTYFDRIFTAEDAKRSKPAPDCYLNAAAHFGFKAEDCYVFEDSLNGLQAGRESGATVIGLSTTYPAESIEKLCHRVIADFTHFTVADLSSL